MKAVVTVVGKDQKGIVAKVSNVLFENDINILDMSQTIMQDMFTMMMLVECEEESSIKDISAQLQTVGDAMGLAIHVQREKIFSSMHRI